MNPLQLIQNISETNTVLLLLALVVVFVIAFKVLEMVFQTILVSALSGGLYLVLTYFISSVSFSLDSLVFFTFIGGTLYTVYNLATKTFKLASISASIPVKLLKSLRKWISSILRSRRNNNEEQEG